MNSSPFPGPPTRAVFGIVLFIVGCLLSSVRIAHDAQNLRDVAKLSDQRFIALKAELPSAGVVGYIGESGDSSVPDYYQAQYALAPLIVDRSVDHTFVVGNFPSGHASTVPAQLLQVKDFGNGVVLFTTKEAK